MYRIFNVHFELEKASKFLNLSQMNVEKRKKRKKVRREKKKGNVA